MPKLKQKLNDNQIITLTLAMADMQAVVLCLAHEQESAAHAAEKSLPPPKLKDVTDPAEWRDYFVNSLEYMLELLREKEPA